MMKLSCKDIGMEDDFVAIGETKDEVMKEMKKHAKEMHSMTDKQVNSKEMTDKMEKAIKSEDESENMEEDMDMEENKM